nr:MAG TPA: hypothetical protein [Caudoviricetes sp.]
MSSGFSPPSQSLLLNSGFHFFHFSGSQTLRPLRAFLIRFIATCVILFFGTVVSPQ